MTEEVVEKLSPERTSGSGSGVVRIEVITRHAESTIEVVDDGGKIELTASTHGCAWDTVALQRSTSPLCVAELSIGVER